MFILISFGVIMVALGALTLGAIALHNQNFFLFFVIFILYICISPFLRELLKKALDNI